MGVCGVLCAWLCVYVHATRDGYARINAAPCLPGWIEEERDFSRDRKEISVNEMCD